ncbi:serine hydrolase domain-containing protein [Micromonospora sonneratiae]|uniref:Serine hydrolase domain-containing protein n=1 Tax=Micromonospora sonneratiae TaxID=1184706 RepID=A0ABW3YGI0_9ACTN
MRGLPRKITRAAGAAVLALAMLVTTATPAAATSGPVPAHRQHGGLPGSELRAALTRVTDAGMIGVFAEVRDGLDTWRGASGTADLDSGQPVEPGYQHRIGSITKTFVATALLQLVGEGRVALDEPVGRYLPDFAVDGVTVRMLLNHTSGVGSYDRMLFSSPEDVERHRTATFDPRELARIGLAMPPTNAPGANFSYSNTNYILAGLILERVTRRPAQLEIYRRIIRPLGLFQTYFPGTNTSIAGPHAKGYVPWYDGELRDFSGYNMSWAGTAGELVSTAADLNRFYRALLEGKLLRPSELTQMRTTVPFDPTAPGTGGYGLGVFELTLPCGRVWGHDGTVFGHGAVSLHTPDGRRQVTLATNLTHYQAPGQPDPIGDATVGFLAAALCGPTGTAATSTIDGRALSITPTPGSPQSILGPTSTRPSDG